MTLQPQFAVELDLSATTAQQVSAKRRRAVQRGDYYQDEWIVRDTSGAAFNLGPTDDPWYVVRSSYRFGPASEGFLSVYAPVCSINNGPAGVISWYSMPEGTRRLIEQQIYWDIEIENVADTRFPIGAVFTIVKSVFTPLGDVTRDADIEGDGSSESSAESNPAAIDSASTVYSSGLHGELGLVDEVSGNELRLRSLLGRQGVQTSLVDKTIVVERKPLLYAPLSRSPLIGYAPEPFCSRRTAGAVDDSWLSDNHQSATAGGSADAYHTAAEHANNTPTKWGYPYMVCGCSVDTYGLPNNDHRRMRGSTSLSPRSGLFGRRLIGYEAGIPLRRGDFTRGRSIVWNLTGAMENVGYSDAFVDFCLDINPDCTAGTYATTHRMRMTSGNREFWTWSGEALFRARIELVALGLQGHAYHGEFHLYDPTTGGHMDSWSCGNIVASGLSSAPTRTATVYETTGTQLTGVPTLAVDVGVAAIASGTVIALLISGTYYTATVTAPYAGGAGNVDVGSWSALGVSIPAATIIYIETSTSVEAAYDWIAGHGLTAYLSVGSQSTGTAALAVDTGASTIEKGAQMVVLLNGIYYSATVTANYVGGTGNIALSGWSRSGINIPDNTPIYVRRDTATVQLRWRVDRDIANRIDTFDDTYQGATNQGSNTLRLHVDRYHVQYVGFRRGGS